MREREEEELLGAGQRRRHPRASEGRRALISYYQDRAMPSHGHVTSAKFISSLGPPGNM